MTSLLDWNCVRVGFRYLITNEKKILVARLTHLPYACLKHATPVHKPTISNSYLPYSLSVHRLLHV